MTNLNQNSHIERSDDDDDREAYREKKDNNDKDAEDDVTVGEDVEITDEADTSETDTYEDEQVAVSNFSQENAAQLLEIAVDLQPGTEFYTSSFFGTIDIFLDTIQTRYDVQKVDSHYCMSIADAADLIENTIGEYDFSSMENAGEGHYCYADADTVYFCSPDIGDYWFEPATVINVAQRDGGFIDVYGYKKNGIYSETTIREYALHLVPNAKSIWGGMMIESVEFIKEEHYYLPDVQQRVYNIDEFYFNEEEYRRARNEIFARHGRKFKSEDLQAYFNTQPWYQGLYDDVPVESLNEFERQNIAVLDEYKTMMGY